MILVYLSFFAYLLYKKTRAIGRSNRHFVLLILAIYSFAMIAYELYIENSVGWELGIPFDDDTGWIYKAATAIHSRGSWKGLYLLAQSASYDTSNRELSFATIGHYIYATFVSLGLYYPVIINIRINLYLIYFTQILMSIITALNLFYMFDNEVGKNYKRKPFRAIMIVFLFCPIVQFSAYKLLRETWYIFAMVECCMLAFNGKIHPKKYLMALTMAIITILLRPLSIVIVIPIYLYCFINLKWGFIFNLVTLFTLLFGNNIIAFFGNIVHWGYNIDTFSVQEVIHLLFFPNVFNQYKNLMTLKSNPSWVTILYFAQSVWNVICLPLSFLGILFAEKKNMKWGFWLLLWINALSVYTYPYNIQSLTPRYKLIFIIPFMYFVTQLFYFLKNRIKVVYKTTSW